ncbi:MAG: site-specific integrase [bacterium]
MKLISLSSRPKPALFSKRATTNPAAAYLASLNSPLSRLTMVSPLNRAAGIMNPSLSGKEAWKAVPWELMRVEHVRAVIAEVAGSPATRNKALAAMKGVARSAWELHLLENEELLRIQSIKGDSGSRELAGRFVTEGEIKGLLRECSKDSTPAGARDAAMIAIAASTGTRRAEIASIAAENLVTDEDGNYRIKIIGKKNKERTIFIRGNAARFLQDWLLLRFEAGSEFGPLFCAILKSGRLLPEKCISPTAADRVLRKRCSQASLSDLDWHDLRRTTTSNLLDAGADISTVAGILGHSNVQTTARYDRRGERARMKATELISVPYFERKPSAAS